MAISRNYINQKGKNIPFITGSKGGCFAAGTLISMADGTFKPIELIDSLDIVLAFDKWGGVGPATVVRLYTHELDEFIKISFDGGELIVTPNHWILDSTGLFKEAIDFNVGDNLVDIDGNLVKITEIDFAARQPSYNFEVSEQHTYIANNIRVHNKGGGKGGGSSSPGVEAPNSLFSTDILFVTNAIGEGPVYRINPNGPQDIEIQDGNIDDLVNLDGNGQENTALFKTLSTTGTVSQAPLDVFGEEIVSPQNFSSPVTLKAGNVPGVPASGVSLQNTAQQDWDALRFSFTIGSLLTQNTSTGDVNGRSVTIRITIFDRTGSDILVRTDKTISGKTNSPFKFTVTVVIPEKFRSTDGYKFSVTKISGDSDKASIREEIALTGWAEILFKKQAYPRTAVIGYALKAHSEHQGGVPNFTSLIKGLLVKVPSNYNQPILENGDIDWRYLELPETGSAIINGTNRNVGYTQNGYLLQKTGDVTQFSANPQIYLGAWDGTFVYSWTQNPVWIIYDILTNSTYGLGVPEENIDKFKFYQVAQYCDACDYTTGRFIGVDGLADGSFRHKPRGLLTSVREVLFGVPSTTKIKERRFICDITIHDQQQAMDILNQIAASFRGALTYSLGKITLAVDLPDEYPVAIFNETNIKSGSFQVSGIKESEILTGVDISYIEPNNHYKREVIRIDTIDRNDGVDKSTIENIAVLDLVGVTRRSQALRFGQYQIAASKFIRRRAQWTTSLDALTLTPGDVVAVQQKQSGLSYGYGGKINKDSPLVSNADIYLEHYTNPGISASTFTNNTYPIVLRVIRTDEDKIDLFLLSDTNYTLDTVDVTSGSDFIRVTPISQYNPLTKSFSTSIVNFTSVNQPRKGYLWSLGEIVNPNDIFSSKSDKLFKISSMTRNEDKEVIIEATEYISNIYVDSDTFIDYTPTDYSDTLSPLVPPPPPIFSLEAVPRKRQDGSITTDIIISDSTDLQNYGLDIDTEFYISSPEGSLLITETGQPLVTRNFVEDGRYLQDGTTNASLLDSATVASGKVTVSFNDISDTGIIWEHGGSSLGMVLYAFDSNIYFQCGSGTAFGSDTDTAEIVAPIQIGTFTLEWSASSDTDTAALYIDGLLVGTDSFTASTICGGDSGGLGEVHNAVAVNRGGWTSDGTGSFNGTIESDGIVYLGQVTEDIDSTNGFPVSPNTTTASLTVRVEDMSNISTELSTVTVTGKNGFESLAGKIKLLCNAFTIIDRTGSESGNVQFTVEGLNVCFDENVFEHVLRVNDGSRFGDLKGVDRLGIPIVEKANTAADFGFVGYATDIVTLTSNITSFSETDNTIEIRNITTNGVELKDLLPPTPFYVELYQILDSRYLNNSSIYVAGSEYTYIKQNTIESISHTHIEELDITPRNKNFIRVFVDGIEKTSGQFTFNKNDTISHLKSNISFTENIEDTEVTIYVDHYTVPAIEIGDNIQFFSGNTFSVANVSYDITSPSYNGALTTNNIYRVQLSEQPKANLSGATLINISPDPIGTVSNIDIAANTFTVDFNTTTYPGNFNLGNSYIYTLLYNGDFDKIFLNEDRILRDVSAGTTAIKARNKNRAGRTSSFTTKSVFVKNIPIQRVENLTLTESLYKEQIGGVAVRVLVTFDAIVGQEVTDYEISYKITGDGSADLTQFNTVKIPAIGVDTDGKIRYAINNVDRGNQSGQNTITVRVTPLNKEIRGASLTKSTLVLGKTAPPLNVFNFTGGQQTDQITLFWEYERENDQLKDLDLKEVVIKRIAGTVALTVSNFGIADPYVTVSAGTARKSVPIDTFGTFTYLARTRDTSGNLSETVTGITLTTIRPKRSATVAAYNEDSPTVDFTDIPNTNSTEEAFPSFATANAGGLSYDDKGDGFPSSIVDNANGSSSGWSVVGGSPTDLLSDGSATYYTQIRDFGKIVTGVVQIDFEGFAQSQDDWFSQKTDIFNSTTDNVTSANILIDSTVGIGSVLGFNNTAFTWSYDANNKTLIDSTTSTNVYAIWSDGAFEGDVYPISFISSQAIARVTTEAAHDLIDGDRVIIHDVVGLTVVNNKELYVDVIDSTTLDLYTDPSLSSIYGFDTSSATNFWSGQKSTIATSTSDVSGSSNVLVDSTINIGNVLGFSNVTFTWSYDANNKTLIDDSATVNVYAIWNDGQFVGTTIAITNITQATPAVVTSLVHGLSNSDRVIIHDVEGMTEINDKELYVSVVNSTAVELYENSSLTIPYNTSTGHTAYLSGGVLDTGDYSNANTYALIAGSINSTAIELSDVYYANGVPTGGNALANITTVASSYKLVDLKTWDDTDDSDTWTGGSAYQSGGVLDTGDYSNANSYALIAGVINADAIALGAVYYTNGIPTGGNVFSNVTSSATNYKLVDLTQWKDTTLADSWEGAAGAVTSQTFIRYSVEDTVYYANGNVNTAAFESSGINDGFLPYEVNAKTFRYFQIKFVINNLEPDQTDFTLDKLRYTIDKERTIFTDEVVYNAEPLQIDYTSAEYTSIPVISLQVLNSANALALPTPIVIDVTSDAANINLIFASNGVAHPTDGSANIAVTVIGV